MKPFWKYTLTIICMGMAGGVRLNMAVLPIFLACWIAIKEWNRDSKLDLIKNLIKYLLIAAITLILIYGPIFLMDLLENGSLNKSLYNLLGVHTNRNLVLNQSLGIMDSLNLLFDGLLRYGAITILIIFLPIYFFFAAIRKGDYRSRIKQYESILLIFLVQLVVFAAYSMLATLFHEYIVTALPITLLLVFIGLSKFFSYNRFHHPNIKLFQKKYQKYILVAVVCIIPLTQIAEINQYVIPRLYQAPDQRLMYNDLSQYDDVSRLLSIVTPPWGYIMTYEPALATQSGRNLMPGNEMAYFSYHHWYEPFGLNPFACIYYHVINGQLVYYQLLSNYTTAAVFTLGQAFFTFLTEVNHPLFYGDEILEVLRTNYTLYIYPWGFGQANDFLLIYLRNNIPYWNA